MTRRIFKQSFGEHGREIVTAELALRFVQSLSNETEFAQYCSNDCSRIKEILTHTIWKIIPMENPNGRDMFEQGKLCERKNGRGVDINRNWDIDFGTKEVDYDPSEEYPGAHAFSEPETQILNKLTEEFKQHVWIGVHSGMCAMFMPYDHIGELPNGTSAEAQLDILKSVKTTNLEASCQFGPGGKTVGYLAHGTGTDYMYSVLKVPLAFTWEIYGDSTADYYDCYKAFNPTTKPLLEETLFRWMEATFHLLLLLPNHPDVDLELLSSPVEQEANPLDLIREQTKFQKQFNESKSYQSISTTAKSTKPRGLNLVGFCLLGFGLAYILYLIRVKRRRIIVKDAKLDI
eukprot:g748.t1